MRNNKNKLIIHLFSIFITQYLPRGIIFCFLFLWGSILNSQDTWLQTYNPFYEVIFSVEDVLICSDGGYAVNGTCVDLDTTIDWGFVLKTDSEGNMQWARKDTVSFQSENDSRAFVETEDGGIISASYHYASGTALIKRDSNGNREWANLLENLYVRSMDKTIDNNIIVAGTQTVNNMSLAMIAKLTENGEVIWSNYFDFENSLWSVIQAVRTSNDGGYLLTGQVRYDETDDAVLVIKTDANGDSLWSRIYEVNPEDDRGLTIVETNEENILVGGYLEGISGFVWKLDSEGNTLWLEIGLENCGYGQISFAKTNNISIVSIYVDINGDNRISKFDSDYNIEWTNDLPYHRAYGDKSIRITPEGNIVVALYNPPYVSLIKLNSDGTDIEENVINISRTVLKAYPNPFNPTINFSFNLEKSSETKIKIFNIKGQLVYTLKEGVIYNCKHTFSWQAVNLSSGIYFAQLQANNLILDIRKIILLK